MNLQDPQAERVYEMERDELGGHFSHKLNLSVLRELAKTVCKEYKVPQVTLYIRRIKGFDGAWHTDNSIYLHADVGMNAATLLHEVAHHITAHLHPKAHNKAPHGGRWVRVYAELLDRCRLVPLAGMRAACRVHKVKMA
jgi:hypothetical protein